MNPKRRVCKITNNFQKAGVMLWQSTVLRRLWHRTTDATQQDTNLWPAPKIEKGKIRVCKKAQSWARRFLERCLWTDETNMNLYLSDGKAKMWRKKGNCKWSQAYSLICKAWWRWRHGIHGCLWNKPYQLYWWLNVWWQLQNEFGRVQNYLAYQYSRKCHQIHWEVLHIASGQWAKTPCQFNQGNFKGKEMESLRFP